MKTHPDNQRIKERMQIHPTGLSSCTILLSHHSRTLSLFRCGMEPETWCKIYIKWILEKDMLYAQPSRSPRHEAHLYLFLFEPEPDLLAVWAPLHPEYTQHVRVSVRRVDKDTAWLSRKRVTRASDSGRPNKRSLRSKPQVLVEHV